jgi:hypothetical protein
MQFRLAIEAEDFDGGSRGRGGEAFQRLIPDVRDRPCDVEKVHRLIAPRLRSRLEVAGQEIRRIGLHHQPIGRNVRHGAAQVRAAALVADPTGDTDAEPERQVVLELGSAAGEAMSHSAGKPAVKVLQYCLEILVGIALM